MQPLDIGKLKPEQAAKAVEEATAEALKKGKRPVMIGGEHSLSAGSIRAIKDFYKDVTVLHFDAHADQRQEYGGDVYSHACIMRRVYDMGVKFVSVGIRSMHISEWQFYKEKKLNIYFMRQLRNLSGWQEMVVSELGPKVYITLDLDVLDPSIMPGTGTPEPGGMSYLDLLEFFKVLSRSNKEVVGFDMVELAPVPGSQVSEFTAAKLLYQMLGLFWKK